jgi:hypothetical protein
MEKQIENLNPDFHHDFSSSAVEEGILRRTRLSLSAC